MSELWLGTFNIAAGKQPDKNVLREWLSEQQIDILGLQEVDEYTKRTPYSMTNDIGANYLHNYFSKAIPFESGEYGNTVLSRFPITQKKSHYYQQFGLEKRLYQRVLIDIQGKDLAIYHTHLSFESQELRRAQVAELLLAVKEESAGHVVILGDFNMDQSLKEWDIFKDYQLVNGWKGVWHRTFNEPDDKMKVFSIDNIILSQNIRIKEVRVSQTELSDHSLLATKISLL